MPPSTAPPGSGPGQALTPGTRVRVGHPALAPLVGTVLGRVEGGGAWLVQLDGAREDIWRPRMGESQTREAPGTIASQQTR